HGARYSKTESGAGNRNRTYDLRITNAPLYQLSYSGERAILAARGLVHQTRPPVHLASRAIEGIDLLQWPAMAVTLFAAWLVGSKQQRRRDLGFWWFVASIILWVAWGWHDQAWALIALQAGLFAMNLRGAH